MDTVTLVDLLEQDPSKALSLPEQVRTPEVFDAFIRRCRALVDSNPREGLPHVDTAMRITTHPCQSVQCWGVRAHVHRELGEVDVALAELATGFLISGKCEPCQAFLLRHRSLAHELTGRSVEALADADQALAIYRGLQGRPDHDLHGNGLAHAHLTRGEIRHYFGRSPRDAELLSGSIKDISTALSLIAPGTSPALYGIAVFNLGVALRTSGGLANLLTADEHIRTAREQYFKRFTHKPTREGAYLDWQTAMVRFELRRFPGDHRNARPYRLRKMLRRALADLIDLGMLAEGSAVASDLARVSYPERNEVLKVIGDVLERVKARWSFFAPEVRKGFAPIYPALVAVRRAALQDVVGVSVEEVEAGIKSAVERLRRTCGEGILPCLLSWPE